MGKQVNFVEMVLGQAKTGREVVGTIAKLVPNNAEYKVTKVDLDEEVVEVTEVLPEDSDAVPEVVEISKKNANIAHYINNPNERPVPEATVKTVNGKSVLVLGDAEINCGQLEVAKILGGVKGNVLLLVKTDTDILALYRYEVQTDKFEVINQDFTVESANCTIIERDGVTLLANTLIVEQDVCDANGKATGEKVQKMMFHDLYQLDGYNLRALSETSEYYDEDEDEYYETESIPVIIPDTVSVIHQSDRTDLVIGTKYQVDDNDIVTKLEHPMIYLYRVNRAGQVCELIDTYEVASLSDTKVYLGGPNGNAPVVTVKEPGKITITTSRGRLVVDDSEVVRSLEGYNYFDGVYSYTDEDGNVGSKWYYSNKAREEVCFTSVETDRGTIFEIR